MMTRTRAIVGHKKNEQKGRVEIIGFLPYGAL
jgi:hypothetical protein